MPSSLARLEQVLLQLRPHSPRFWLACALPSLPVIALFAYAAIRTSAIARRGQFVEGTVVSTHCSAQGAFRYRFTAGGRVFEDRGRAARLHLACDSLGPGTSVPVYYLPEHPSTHLASADPRSLVRRYLVGAVVGGVFVILGVAALLYTYPTWPKEWRGA